ncbi:hypothetical protein Tco_1536261 [Tanacetum coccineum]
MILLLLKGGSLLNKATAIRSRPPTRTQLRNQMITYLKHVGGKKHTDLKNKNFEEIQVLYKKVKRSDKDFIAIGSAEDERQIKEMNEESKDPKKKRVVNETLREEDTAKVPAKQEVTKQGTKKRKSGQGGAYIKGESFIIDFFLSSTINLFRFEKKGEK